MEEEITRRLNILNKKNCPKINQRQLRGGMQSRLQRQEILRHGENIDNQKKNLQERLSLIQKEKQPANFSKLSSAQVSETLNDWDEPVFRKIRSRRGFFDL